MKKTYQIYLLFDPRTPEHIRYVGFTTNSLDYRLFGHVTDRGRTYKAKWIRSLLKINIKPVIQLYKRVTADTWVQEEMAAIAKFKLEGHKLTNGSAGGECGGRWGQSKAITAKRSISLKKWWSDPNNKASRIDDMKNRYNHPESIRLANELQVKRESEGYSEQQRLKFNLNGRLVHRARYLIDPDYRERQKLNRQNFIKNNPDKIAAYNERRRLKNKISRDLNSDSIVAAQNARKNKLHDDRVASGYYESKHKAKLIRYKEYRLNNPDRFKKYNEDRRLAYALDKPNRPVKVHDQTGIPRPKAVVDKMVEGHKAGSELWRQQLANQPIRTREEILAIVHARVAAKAALSGP